MEALKILGPIRGDAGQHLLRRHTFAFRLEHDRRAVRIVGADEMHLVAEHALEPHPDVGLDVLHDVTDVKRSIGVRQCGRDEEITGGHGGSRDGMSARLCHAGS